MVCSVTQSLLHCNLTVAGQSTAVVEAEAAVNGSVFDPALPISLGLTTDKLGNTVRQECVCERELSLLCVCVFRWKGLKAVSEILLSMETKPASSESSLTTFSLFTLTHTLTHSEGWKLASPAITRQYLVWGSLGSLESVSLSKPHPLAMTTPTMCWCR